MARFLAICLSSTIQRTVVFENLALENVNRSKKYRMDASGQAVNSARILNELENVFQLTDVSISFSEEYKEVLFGNLLTVLF